MKPPPKQLMSRENVTFVFQCKCAYLIVKGARERREVASKERGPKGSLEKPASSLLGIPLM